MQALPELSRETPTLDGRLRETVPPIPNGKWLYSRIFHFGLWIGLGAALILSGASPIRIQVAGRRFGAAHPFHSINRYLWGVHDSDRSTRLLHALSALPNEKTFVIFMDDTAESSMAGVALSYLAWPRPVQTLFLSDATSEKKFNAIKLDAVSAVIFCNANAPAWFSERAVRERRVEVVSFRATGEEL